MNRLPFAALALAAPLAHAQTQPQTLATRTVPAINTNPTGFAPRGGSWSPDSRLYTFLAGDSVTLNHGVPVGSPGDIVQIEAATGRASVLATAAQLAALSSAPISEKDQDHRNRYGMSTFLWADDSRHLMLDNGGRLWLYDIASAKGSLIVDTGAGSGDDPKFSPDSRSVSYIRDHNLYIHPLAPASGLETALTSNGSDALLNGELDWVYLEELDGRSNYFWSPDSSAVAYLQMNESKVPEFPLIDWIPTHATVDSQRYPQPGDPNPAVRVGIVPAAGGPTRFIDLPGFSPSNDYIPRFGWVDAKTLYIEVLTRDHQHLNLYFADARPGSSPQVALVHTETDPKYLDDNYDVTFLPAGRLALTSWRDGHTHAYLFHFDPAHPLDHPATLLRQLTHGNFDVQNLEAHGETLFYTSNQTNVLDSQLWAVATDGGNPRLLTPTPGVHDTGLSPNGLFFSDGFSTNRTPPTVSLCPVASGQISAQSAACATFWKSDPIPPATGVSSSRVSFLAADGKTILYGILTLPSAASAPATVPIILNPYGGPLPFMELTNSWQSGELFSELLAQHGFAVLNLENRGMGGRGRDFQQACFRNFGAVQLADQLAALDQLLARTPQVDPHRVGWWGWSWGGSFTLYAMTHSTRIRAGVAVAPVTDFRNYDSIYTERYLGLPSAPDAPYKTFASTTSAASLHGRLLIAQGTGDDNVHLSNIIQFINPLVEAGIPYDLQLFPRKTHSIAGPESRNELFTRILTHFETYLK